MTRPDDGIHSKENSWDDPAITQNVLDDLRHLNLEVPLELLQELFELYFQTTPPLLLAMRQSLETNNAQALSRAAHKLRGGSAALGLTQFASLCAVLEEKPGDLQQAGPMIHCLETLFAIIRQTLKNL